MCGIMICEDCPAEDDTCGTDTESILLKATSISAEVNPLLRRKDFFVSKELPTTLLFWRNFTAVTTYRSGIEESFMMMNMCKFYYQLLSDFIGRT